MQIVEYKRVSTAKQGQSGLGLEAQEHMIQSYCKSVGAVVVASFTEVESGRKNKRIELQKAIDLCAVNGYTLVIAKLDRLSRNASFTLALCDSGIEFVCCDMPSANKMTISIMAVIAQHEAEMTSKRTSEALQAKIRRGEKVGTPENLTTEARLNGLAIRKENARKANAQVAEFFINRRAKGQTLQTMANAANDIGYTTRRGKQFTPTQASRIIQRYKADSINN